MTSRIATPEPPPTKSSGSVVDDLVAMLHERRDFGVRKYGTELQPFNGRNAHLDALQELVDLFQYIHQAEMERVRLEADIAKLREEISGLQQDLVDETYADRSD